MLEIVAPDGYDVTGTPVMESGVLSVSLDPYERHLKTWTKLSSFPNQGYERFHLDDRLRILSLHTRVLVIASSSVAHV